MGGNFVNQQKENCMKNNIFKIIIFFLALVSLGACDDGCEDYLDQYESILYFKNNGEQHVTIYDTSNEASCEFTVIRAGYNSKKYSTVDVSVLDAVNIQIYNAEMKRIINCYLITVSSWKHQHWRLKIPITTKR